MMTSQYLFRMFLPAAAVLVVATSCSRGSEAEDISKALEDRLTDALTFDEGTRKEGTPPDGANSSDAPQVIGVVTPEVIVPGAAFTVLLRTDFRQPQLVDKAIIHVAKSGKHIVADGTLIFRPEGWTMELTGVLAKQDVAGDFTLEYSLQTSTGLTGAHHNRGTIISSLQEAPDCIDGPCCNGGKWVAANSSCVSGRDNNPCTEDLCDAEHACTRRPLEDNSACALDETMRMGTCQDAVCAATTLQCVESIDFGAILLGQAADRTIICTNTGGAALRVNDAHLASATTSEFSLMNPPSFPASVQPAESINFTVRYAPVDPGSDSGSLLILTDGGETSVALQSQYKGKATLEVFMSELAFGEVMSGHAKTIAVTIGNQQLNQDDNATLAIYSIETESRDTDIFEPLLIPAMDPSVTGTPIYLNPGDQFMFDVAFHPTVFQAAAYTDAIIIKTNDEAYMEHDFSLPASGSMYNPESDGDAEAEEETEAEPDTEISIPAFVTITAGAFIMGSPDGLNCPPDVPGCNMEEYPAEPGHAADETQHLVTLTHHFEIGRYEVTQDEFAAVMGWNPSQLTDCDGGDGGACPVEYVSWFDAVAYANEVSLDSALTPCFLLSDVICADATNTGTNYMNCMNTTQGGINSATVALNGVTKPQDCEGFRLPTEAEWEFAARAGSTTGFYNGEITNVTQDPKLDQIGWYYYNSDTGSGEMTHPCGQKTANSWGLHDMSGNVYEWVWDWFQEAYETDNGTNPVGPTSGSFRVARGGAWNYEATSCRSANRGGGPPDFRSIHQGFRLARSLP